MTDPASLTGEVAQVVFANPETGWTVVRLSVPDEPGLVTAVGALGRLVPGEMVRLCGAFQEHPRFGRQFGAVSCERTVPATERGIERYLGSGLIRGIGPALAKRLVETFGAEVLEIIEQEPKKLLRVEGIGKAKLAGITESWSAQREVRELMLFLQSHEVPATHASQIVRQWGSDAVSRLRENPYELASIIQGIGFRTADKMALKLGFAPDAPERLEAALIYGLQTASDRGNIYLPADELFAWAAQMLAGGAPEGGVPGEGPTREALELALQRLCARKKVVVQELPAPRREGDFVESSFDAVYLHKYYREEREGAVRLGELLAHPAASADAAKLKAVLPGIERGAGLELSEEQRGAVLGAVEHKAFILTGGPGTGKTTITRLIVAALATSKMRFRLAAPTGRAAKRLSEAAGEPAQTLHRLLGYTPEGGFTQREDNKLKIDALIVDEASMLDQSLFTAVLKALPLTCRLILVGDSNQLPSVGPGNVLADLLASGVVPHAQLSHIYRQALASSIVVNAHRVNAGQEPLEDPDSKPPVKDFWWIVQDDPAKVRDLVVQTVCERIPQAYSMDALADVQVLTPMHKGEVGTIALNEILQERLNPCPRELVRGRMRFRPGDRVIQLRNNYEKEIFNGDLGRVVDLNAEARQLTVDFEGREIEFESGELEELTLAYAVSVHKAQGSEYPAVVIPLVTQHYVLLQRNLLYTAITRARKLCVLVAGRRAVQIALATIRADHRHTGLRHRLVTEACQLGLEFAAPPEACGAPGAGEESMDPLYRVQRIGPGGDPE